jgi:phosphohistidine phosphatase
MLGFPQGFLDDCPSILSSPPIACTIMKTLLVMRHAESSWDAPGLQDHDRPLNSRGVHDATRIGRLLVEENLVPARIFSSTAVRTLSTTELVVGEFGVDVEVQITRNLYLASSHTYIDVLKGMGGEGNPIMVVGHNPGVSALVRVLSREYKEMTTAALAAIELDINTWSDIEGRAEGRLIGCWRPEDRHD